MSNIIPPILIAKTILEDYLDAGKELDILKWLDYCLDYWLYVEGVDQ